MPQYIGHCHCKKNSYEVHLTAAIDSPDLSVISCNCSISSSNGYLMVFVDDPSSNIQWDTGAPGTLKEYRLNRSALTHMFCGECGSSLCVKGEIGGVERFGLSIRTVDGIDDLSTLKVKKFDGRNIMK